MIASETCASKRNERGVPQSPQKPRAAVFDDQYSVGAPLIHAKPPASRIDHVKKGAPPTFRQVPQWQIEPRSGPPVAR